MAYTIRRKRSLFWFSSCCFEKYYYYALFFILVLLSDAVKVVTFLSLLCPLPCAACQRHEIYSIGKASPYTDLERPGRLQVVEATRISR
jgi:hypothetical protein